jgi:hypothetical protein
MIVSGRTITQSEHPKEDFSILIVRGRGYGFEK